MLFLRVKFHPVKFAIHFVKRNVTGCALAEEAADAVVTGGAVEAGGASAVVDVLRTVGSGPAVDADARVAAVRVGTRGAVLADAGPQRALVYVLVAVRSRERRRTLARVAVDAVDARRSVLAQVARAIVHVLLTVGAVETCHKQTNKI